jgi:hypothetical protein
MPKLSQIAMRIRRRLPGRPDRKADGAAGLTVGIASVPDGMAASVLAGVNPVHGLLRSDGRLDRRRTDGSHTADGRHDDERRRPGRRRGAVRSLGRRAHRRPRAARRPCRRTAGCGRVAPARAAHALRLALGDEGIPARDRSADRPPPAAGARRRCGGGRQHARPRVRPGGTSRPYPPRIAHDRARGARSRRRPVEDASERARRARCSRDPVARRLGARRRRRGRRRRRSERTSDARAPRALGVLTRSAHGRRSPRGDRPRSGGRRRPERSEPRRVARCRFSALRATRTSRPVSSAESPWAAP